LLARGQKLPPMTCFIISNELETENHITAITTSLSPLGNCYR
jgi:hypothetical protein